MPKYIVTEVCAVAFAITCPNPECGEYIDGYLDKPSGTDTCHFCGCEFEIHKEADIESF